MQTRKNRGLSRRSFLGAGMAATGGLAAIAAPPPTEGTKAKTNGDTSRALNYKPEMRYRRLGQNDIYLSALSLGGTAGDEALFNYAIDRGVNLIHMAAIYRDGQMMQMLGKILKIRRSQVYVALKDDVGDLDEALRILNTDHVDFYMFNRNDARAVPDPRIRESIERYRDQGKIKLAGLTSHGDVKAATAAGIESGIFDVVMPTLNQSGFEDLQTELAAASRKDVGVMAMKTMKGIASRELQLAQIKKLLAHPGVTTVLKGFDTYEMFDAYLKAAKDPLTADEDRALYRHAQAHRASNCMMCDECRKACPRDVAVSSILRCKEYYLDEMRDMRMALAEYRSLAMKRRGDAECFTCQQCVNACPNGIPVVLRLLQAQRALDLLSAPV